ncbi:glycerol kinase GlpK [Tautonia plasticadhaerens]|uniref:ATP:glycerol 3-phosphotransferase n=1 Tax=Tautonia plasticadhaerens TaxID=2527974 RepID=A0A518H4J9_9BACT|nr:glycerol kinase GlpK [Tautonia plasticadhaerens]QDV35760.1 Glycerol kinase [Tautonia plasticadhaerens]
MARDRILVIDQGTTSTRAVVYDTRLRPVGQGQVEVPPTYPKPGWVEHDPAAIVDSIGRTVSDALADAKVGADRIAAIGLTNQRETTVLWDRGTGEAVGPAIVWQDRRTADLCRSLSGRADWLAGRTGLLLDSYFSATKLSWMLEHLPGVRTRAESGDLAFGTVDSLVLRHLTGGKLHATDVTNASRTLLMDLRAGRWADDLCEYFGIPPAILPEIVPSSGEVGRTSGLGYLPDGLPIAGIAGDQQASLFGNGCVEVGQAKCTYGTGAFLLVNTGTEVVRSTAGLVTTPAATPPGQAQQYALEGSVFIAGAAVQWFRDGLKAIGAAPEINPLSEEAAPDSEVLFVPALTGLGAPHWEPEARGTIFGITRGTTVPDLARAVIEGVAYQIVDLVEAMNADLPTPLESLRADGGMARSDPFLRFQADLMGLPLHRSPQTEATALGAGALAGLGVGLWPDAGAVAELLESGGEAFEPRRDRIWRRRAMRRWRHAVETVRRHYRTG